jgi:putative FmdB family regulatory protein
MMPPDRVSHQPTPVIDNIVEAMPIYEYLCESCGNKFEKLVRRSDDVLGSGCPSCGQKHLKQEYSTFAALGASESSRAAPAQMGGCPGGMCTNPGMCGRN